MRTDRVGLHPAALILLSYSCRFFVKPTSNLELFLLAGDSSDEQDPYEMHLSNPCHGACVPLNKAAWRQRVGGKKGQFTPGPHLREPQTLWHCDLADRVTAPLAEIWPRGPSTMTEGL